MEGESDTRFRPSEPCVPLRELDLQELVDQLARSEREDEIVEIVIKEVDFAADATLLMS